ncbi:MAG: P-loop NTPase fold protein, partial [Bacteroidota bacterium]
NILAALLKEIRDQLSFKYKLLNGLGEAAVVGALSALQSIELSFQKFGINFGLKKLGTHLKENQREYQQQRFSEPLNSVLLKKMLEQAIDQLLSLDRIIKQKSPTDGRKAVIFIDDLDRCEPETAFQILEAIKVYLDLNNCVFVLGMDMRAVEEMIARHYQQKEGVELSIRKNRARLYLEKICQDIYLLPVISEKAKLKYIKGLLQNRLGMGHEAEGQILSLIRQY